MSNPMGEAEWLHCNTERGLAFKESEPFHFSSLELQTIAASFFSAVGMTKGVNSGAIRYLHLL